MDLSKAQKKKVRELIDIALYRDYTDGIIRVKKLVNNFEEGTSDPREFYFKLYENVKTKDKQIALRYNGLTGSRYLSTLISLLQDGVVYTEELEILDVELRSYILSWLESVN
ncbi:MAG: hypothetical protein PHD61_12640 [Bacteroidales bacterium]|nr:hypothetical protein [Lentimicrobiaceae bacterium]MDD5696137.1 hypothetical protein [Bacteroidales bacterium]